MIELTFSPLLKYRNDEMYGNMLTVKTFGKNIQLDYRLNVLKYKMALPNVRNSPFVKFNKNEPTTVRTPKTRILFI